MDTKPSFCDWADATAFMRSCLEFSESTPERLRSFVAIAERLESPLELLMLSAIWAARAKVDLTGGQVQLAAALPIGPYRADLVARVLIGEDQQLPAVVVECDGFNFHDRTRDQACRDRARDRYMQRKQYRVARFAGDEIVERPFACALEVLDMAMHSLVPVDYEMHPDGGWPLFRRYQDGDEVGPPSLRGFDAGTLPIGSL